MIDDVMVKEMHTQITIQIDGDDLGVDERIAGLVKLVNGIGIDTYASCQNYGEYLRMMDLDHVFEAQRDYAYIEFYDLEDALHFIKTIGSMAGVMNPLFHQIAHEGTPGAFELKYRPTSEQFWVWFPSEDIAHIEEVLQGAKV